MCSAGDFADGFVVTFGAQFGAGRWQGANQFKLAKGAMDGCAGANALDDFLSKIAALVEVEGAGLVGFLWEIAIAHIDAVEGHAFEDAKRFDGIKPGGFGPGLRENSPDFSHVLCSDPKLEPGNEHAVGADNHYGG